MKLQVVSLGLARLLTGAQEVQIFSNIWRPWPGQQGIISGGCHEADDVRMLPGKILGNLRKFGPITLILIHKRDFVRNWSVGALPKRTSLANLEA